MKVKSVLTKIISNYHQKKIIRQNNKTMSKINSIKDDVEKILEFEKLKSEQQAFVIINKSKSQAEVYKNGKVINSYAVGVGKTVGDDLNTVKYSFKEGSFSESGRTTPSGEFKTVAPHDFNIINKSDYTDDNGVNMLLLKGVQHPADYKERTMIALHEIPNTMLERNKMFEINGSRRSMSTGCVNFRKEDFKQLAQEINPTGTPVYILPEEKGNRLELISTPNGLWFKTNYKDKEKASIFETAFRKFFRLDK